MILLHLSKLDKKMRKIRCTPIVKSSKDITQIKYQVIQDPLSYSHSPCIVVPHLSPDYDLLFGSLKLIITQTGSPLSHLAIVAREFNIPVFRSKNIISKINQTGLLSLTNNNHLHFK